MTGKQTVGLNSKAATIYAGQGRSELCGQQNSKNSQIQPKQPKNQNDNINNSHMSIWPVGQLAVPSPLHVHCGYHIATEPANK